ncbi:MAG: hypothetical protein AVDCRST_MAG57-145, partial [uncultured Blastococcus sp.]
DAVHPASGRGAGALLVVQHLGVAESGPHHVGVEGGVV